VWFCHVSLRCNLGTSWLCFSRLWATKFWALTRRTSEFMRSSDLFLLSSSDGWIRLLRDFASHDLACSILGPSLYKPPRCEISWSSPPVPLLMDDCDSLMISPLVKLKNFSFGPPIFESPIRVISRHVSSFYKMAQIPSLFWDFAFRNFTSLATQISTLHLLKPRDVKYVGDPKTLVGSDPMVWFSRDISHRRLS